VEVREPDLAQIRVFPTGPMAESCAREFSITEVAERMRVRQSVEESPFPIEDRSIRERLQQEDDA